MELDNKMNYNQKFPWENETQGKNLAWYLPRPKKHKYKGGMPLHCEEWLIMLAKFLINKDDPKILQVFAGMGKYGIRVDLNQETKPDYLIDVHELTKHIKEKFDIILADPPYSNNECGDMYGVRIKLNYKKWTSECTELLNTDGIFIVYHKLKMPNPNPEIYNTVKRVLILSAPHHQARIALFFKKRKEQSKGFFE